MTDSVVVSLCDRSGNMVRPWAEAGYDCLAVDIKNDDSTEGVGDGSITFVRDDVRKWPGKLNRDVRIAFAFPPCTNLAVSGARWFKDKGLRALSEAIGLVAACHDTVTAFDCPWVLENPISTLSTYWREPDYKFHPYQFDGYTERNERYTKETWLWTGGGFRMPMTDGVRKHQADDRIHKMAPSDARAEKRAETPMGFARAVYLANEFDEYAVPGSGFRQQKLTQ